MSFSPLARQVTPYKTGPRRGAAPWGLVVHTPGSTIIEQARKLQRDPLEHVVGYYRAPSSYSPTYVLGYRGLSDLVQIADERDVTYHAGTVVNGFNDYPDLLSGAWRGRTSPKTATLWDAVWHKHGVRDPADLWPGGSCNRAYLGVEVLPLSQEGPDGLRYTDAQHDAVAALYADLAARWAWSPGEVGRLVGHEDVNPVRRSDAGGGWDPGALRDAPRWDWARVGRQVGWQR